MLAPQLPEVEMIRKFLQDVCLRPKAKTIKSIKAFYPNIIKSPKPTEFINKLIGQKFIKVDRYGTLLILKFQKNSVIVNLKMQGNFALNDKKYVQEEHDHIQFLFSDGKSLVYNDPRKSGTMDLVQRGKQMEHSSLNKLGPEVNNQKAFTFEYLAGVTASYNGTIKQLLLDQQRVCGVGNVYADEILFKAKIIPSKKTSSLNQKQIRDLVVFGKQTIESAAGQKGNIVPFRLNVFGRQGQQCYDCTTGSIIKTFAQDTETYLCNNCQQ